MVIDDEDAIGDLEGLFGIGGRDQRGAVASPSDRLDDVLTGADIAKRRGPARSTR